jgi:hypothetical protein
MFKYKIQLKITRISHIENPPPPETRHLIEQDLALIKVDKNGHWIISAPSPDHCNDKEVVFEGRGASVSIAIVDYLKSLISSREYFPKYFKK